MALATKLNLKPGVKVRVIGRPRSVDLDDVATTTAAAAPAVLVFAATKAELDAKGAPFVAAAREDRLAWVAYPKAGQLDTDLSRDVVWKHLAAQGIQPVRQIAIDATWSALRFRPGTRG
ncbi:MAG: hypothetical protein U0229_10410 [Anaeromyxobacter sp.]|mgnify:CR=1 FL=1